MIGRLNIGDGLYKCIYMSDVRFEVEGEIINAHKFILSFKSKIFNDMFHGVVELKDIKIEDISKEVFEIILKYIYTNDINFYSLDVNQLMEILYGAKKYMLLDVINKCIGHIQSHTIRYNSEKEILPLYLISSIHPEINADLCLDILKKKEAFVFISKSFLDSSVDLIRKFITSLPNSKSSTKQMTQFLIKWAKIECDKCQIPDNSNNIMQKLKDNKLDFISYILDFCSEDIISVVRERKLLEDTEMLEIIIKNINTVPVNF
ncbi:BTB/POZ domain-containing protein 6-A-like [Gordionus sp. m RMFG-2023]|uniref:BTB/POZ domain-containing protein 6-A-like n=1 Tax=Gordionus sp. m RMFG-2023 TaxID=3053472 RepID=UPI0031FE07CF